MLIVDKSVRCLRLDPAQRKLQRCNAIAKTLLDQFAAPTSTLPPFLYYEGDLLRCDGDFNLAEVSGWVELRHALHCWAMGVSGSFLKDVLRGGLHERRRAVYAFQAAQGIREMEDLAYYALLEASIAQININTTPQININTTPQGDSDE
jgi:hypothetical protein